MAVFKVLTSGRAFSYPIKLNMHLCCYNLIYVKGLQSVAYHRIKIKLFVSPNVPLENVLSWHKCSDLQRNVNDP